MSAAYYLDPRGPHRDLLVLLPGAYDAAASFESEGILEALREQGLPLDVVAADAAYAYYLNGSIGQRLHEDVIIPARRRGYERIWIGGISLGGWGSLLYTREHPEEVSGVLCVAPFLGTRGLIAEVERAGGLGSWNDPGRADDHERGLLVWLREHTARPDTAPPIYVAYGEKDRFAAAHRMLAQRLPDTHVAAVAGGHDWPTWRVLWQRLFQKYPWSG
jgi:pimeloyl-ACP methyl ester carboxylesterase